MIDYTKAAIEIISDDVKRMVKIYKIATIVAKVVPFVYFIYTIVTGIAFPVINVTFCVLSMIFIIREVIVSKKINDYKELLPFAKRKEKKNIQADIRELKNKKKTTLLAKKWIKAIDSTLDLLFMIYAIFATTTHLTWVSVMLTVMVVLTWLFHLIVLVATLYISNRKQLLCDAVKMDVDNLVRPITTVGNAIKKIVTGKESEESAKTKERKFLDKIVGKK